MGRFKVGDLVRVREWDDMKKEFGSDGDLRIYCKCSFIYMMKDTCGDVCTIKDLTESGNYKLSGKKESGRIYSEDMLYPAITYREYAEKVEPKRIESFHYGGVEGCPFSLPGMCQGKLCFCEAPNYSDEVCGKCWNRYITEREYELYKKYVNDEVKEGEKDMKFRKGDYVRVVKATDGDGANWVPSMDGAVGKIYKIKQSDKDKTCKLEGIDLFWFPFEALEPVSLKDILTPFCTVKLRDGAVGVFDGKDRILLDRGFIRVSERGDDLKGVCERDIDVIDICLPSPSITSFEDILKNRGECIWKQEELVEITVEEAAKKLKDQYGGAEVKIVV